MDVILTILCVLLMVLVTAVYQFNKVVRVNDLEALFIEMTKLQPNLVSFTLRYDSYNKKYINVFVDSRTGKIVSKRENNPVDFNGNYISRVDHGTVKDLDDGFQISGMEMINFKCPSGYEGPTCRLKPLCEPGIDDNRLKPLTYTQFNDLHLSYNGTSIISSSRTRRSQTSEQTHPRIRIRCMTNGDYQLESCPANMLLSNDMECLPYDICTDHFNGYKHNYKIKADDPPLKADEYYICSDNRSERMKCSDGTVFSSSNNGCITRSVCWGKGNSTLPRDEKSYILCGNDIGTIVYCDNKAIETSNGWKCYAPQCQEEKLTVSNNELSYTYGIVECVNDEPRSIVCDQTTESKTFRFDWATSFEYTIDAWPKEVFRETDKRCVSADSMMSDILNPVKMSWSPAMLNQYDFDLVNKQFVCDESTTKYRWDYANGQVVPTPPPDLFVDTGAPCQTKAYEWTELPWRNYPIVRFPVIDETKPYTKPPLLIGTEVSISSVDVSALWPYYDPTSKKFRNDIVSFDVSNRTLVVSKYTTDVAPAGFLNDVNPRIRKRDGGQLLQLVGFGKYPYNVDNDDDTRRYQWYVIAGGKFDAPRNSGTSETISIPAPTTIDMRITKEYSIIWDLLPDQETSFKIADRRMLIHRSKGIRNIDAIYGKLFDWQPPGFVTIRIEYDDTLQVSMVTYRSISIDNIPTKSFSTFDIPYIK